MIKNYITIALRHLTKSKKFTLINISGLTVGMAVTLLILNYISFEYSYDNMHKDGDRVYRVESQFYEHDQLTDDWAVSAFGYASAMKQNISGIEDFVRVDIHLSEQVVSYKDNIFREERVVFTEPSLFNIFTINLIEGDQISSLSRPNTVVISELIAYKYFKGDNPIGKMMKFKTVDQTIECEVTAVMENFPPNSHISYDFLISWETQPDWIKDFWYIHGTYSYVMLEPGINPEDIEAAFPEMSEKYKTWDALKNKTWAIELTPLKDIHLTKQKQYEKEVKGSRKATNALVIVAFAILLIAWINYINLTTARSMDRAKEVGVRKVSGASKKELIIQFFTESAIVNVISLILAFILLIVLITPFNSLIGKDIGLIIFTKSEFWVTTISVTIIGTLLSGFYPSFILSSITPALIIKGRYINSKGGANVRKALVFIQFAISLILICGTFTIYAQLKYMQDQPLGLNIEQTAVIKYPAHTESIPAKIESFKMEIEKLPDVLSITTSNAVPGRAIGQFSSNHLWNDASKQNRLYEMLTVDCDFIDTYKLEIIEGRGFDRSFANDSNSVVLNEEAVKQLGFSSNREALHQKVALEGEAEPVEVIGVLKNFHQQSLDKSHTPIMLIMNSRISWLPASYITVKLIGESSNSTITGAIQDRWRDLFPGSTYDYFFTEEYYNDQYAADRRFGSIFGLFAILTIGIACLGLWALALFMGLNREKELGVRKTLGASTANLLYNLSKEIMTLTIASTVIGLPVAYILMDRWIDSYAFKTELSWWLFAAPALLLIVISFITIWQQTYKTVKSNPIDSLKSE